MKYFLTLIAIHVLLSFNSTPVSAQENNFWAFTMNGGLNFNSGAPQYVQTIIESRGNAASICNHQGELLFYTDGNFVWDKNNNIMGGGTNLTNATGPFNNTDPGNGWIADATAISMKPGSPNQYYIFSEKREKIDPTSGSTLYYVAKLYYSMVDMSMNNGLGAVSERGVYVDSNVQRLSLVQGDDCNIWLLTHEGIGGAYKAYEITSDGIAPPVISNTNNIIPAANNSNNTTIDGSLIISPNRRKLALSGMFAIVPGTIGVELADFDPATGIVSNTTTLPFPSANLPGGYIWMPDGFWSFAAFSPDNTKLYVCSGYMAQYDLTTSPYNGMVIGQIMTGNTATGLIKIGTSDFKLGPDGKIYFHYSKTIGNGTPFPIVSPNVGALGVINDPNVAGSGCNVSLTPVLTMNPNPFMYGGHFPNEIGVLRYEDTITTYKSICFNDSLRLLASNTLGYGYTWQGVAGSASKVVHYGGLYVAQYYTHNPCVFHVDSFQTREAGFGFDLGNDTTICIKPPYELAVMVPRATYRWQDGSTANSYGATTSGSYKIAVTKNNCTLEDSVQLTFIDLRQQLGNDILLCKGDLIHIPLHAREVGNAAIRWNDGSTKPDIIVRDTGSYWVEVSESICKETDTIQVSYDPLCYCYFAMPNAFSPNGDGVNDIFQPSISAACPVQAYALYVYNRFGQRVFSSAMQDRGWDGTYNGVQLETGTYMYEIHFTGGTRKQEYRQKGDVTLIR